MKSKRPIQDDVAQRAGVSRGTVSLVLNQIEGRASISQETRKRVWAAAKALGYSPNPVAQMLARGRNYIIGFFTFDDTFPYAPTDFYNPYLVGVEREAGAQGYNVLLFTRNQAKTPHPIYQDWLNSLLLADGVILTGNCPDSTVLRQLANQNYPLFCWERAISSIMSLIVSRAIMNQPATRRPTTFLNWITVILVSWLRI
jgi:DNA-binding LacI/PurR family transcriptional regulator